MRRPNKTEKAPSARANKYLKHHGLDKRLNSTKNDKVKVWFGVGGGGHRKKMTFIEGGHGKKL